MIKLFLNKIISLLYNVVIGIKRTFNDKQVLPIFPISFSIPSEKIVDKVPVKNKLIAHIIPGKLSTYIYENEKDYYKDYQNSYFAHTKKKAGYDCMRHLEILANGCIPIFENIESIPKNTMTHYPIDLLKHIYEEDLINNFDKVKYDYYANKLLEWTKINLTCVSMAKYILRKTNHEHIQNILFISEGNVDYLRCLTLIGFKKIFGKKCHDYPKVKHIYTDYSENTKKLYGKGFSTTKIVNKHYRKTYLTPIQNLILNHYFDIVIYGSIHRSNIFMNLVQKVYKSNEIILLCGEDLHDHCVLDKYPNNYRFKREL